MWHHVDVVDLCDELGGGVRLGLSHHFGEFGVIGPRLQPLVPLFVRPIAANVNEPVDSTSQDASWKRLSQPSLQIYSTRAITRKLRWWVYRDPSVATEAQRCARTPARIFVNPASPLPMFNPVVAWPPEFLLCCANWCICFACLDLGGRAWRRPPRSNTARS